MYKTMIIDDDAAVRERLKDIIDWQGLSLDLVCEAGDSDTAIEMYLLYRPKIIISDISIPRISGLELAEVMRKEDADIQFIIITGYHDFEWAKQSVRLGAIDLLSKLWFCSGMSRFRLIGRKHCGARKESGSNLACLTLPAIPLNFIPPAR